ncbi:MAG: Ni/Fe hydrogenase subunit alpha [Caldilineaceae bacterium]
MSTTKTIKVGALARVEGEGALTVKVHRGELKAVELRIFEPPRFFEGFLQGRRFTEAPDLTARICGICPVAYQMSSVHAMEDACGVTVDGPLREMRRLIYCGEWIESHVLHVYMLHAPDFLGFQDAIRMAGEYPQAVERGLRLKQIGNEIVTLMGGREIHPINVRVGGFYRIPTKAQWKPILEELKWALDAALETVRWTATLQCPEFEQDYEFVALRHPEEYPFNEGHIVSNRGLDIPVQDFEAHFEEVHKPYSTALHCVRKETGSYHVGPMARFNLNFDRLTPAARDVALETGIGPVCNNPFQSIVVRSVETVFAVEEAIRILEEYEMPDAPAVPVEPKAGVGCGASEAPRGLLYHRYEIDDNGVILNAKITPPTAQNQGTMESDLWSFVPPRINLPKADLQWQCEQAIRNYDPCISCSAHYLKLDIQDY